MTDNHLSAVPDISGATIPAPPEGLGDAGSRFWVEMCSTFDFDGEAHKLAILEQASRIQDSIEEYEEMIKNQEVISAKYGSTGQTTVNPLIELVRKLRTDFTNQVKALKLPDTDEERAQLSRTRAKAGRRGANERWKREGVR